MLSMCICLALSCVGSFGTFEGILIVFEAPHHQTWVISYSMLTLRLRRVTKVQYRNIHFSDI